jgi:dihydrofolate synthase/folylpolyglutamate synthase
MSFASYFKYLNQAQLFGIRLGLENIKALLDSLAQPQFAFPVIHVAGTNGKGSVCAMLERILREHGFKTGLYTSPHLVDVRERIRVNGQMISSEDLGLWLKEIKRQEEKLKKKGQITGQLTYFEILTAAAFLHFREKKVEMAVLEVGMGGRYDATNVVDPEVAVITSISYDHQQYLGETIEKIAGEKAGIIKPGKPCVSGARHKEAARVIRKKCQEVSAPLVEVFGRGRKLSLEKASWPMTFVYQTEHQTYRFSPSLPGFHQGENSAIAISVLEVLKKQGWKIEKRKILKGISQTEWPGRLEVVSHTPLIIMDGCHNEEGARAVSDYLKKFVNQPLILVFAVMKDKEVEKIARYLFPLASRIVLTRPPVERAALPEEVARKLPEFGGKYFLEEDVFQALRLALALSEGQVPILIAGSLYLVGEAKKFFSDYRRS